MKISGTNTWTLSNKDDFSAYARQINEKYPRLKIRSSNYLTSRDVSTKAKAAVVVSPELLKKAAANENVSDQLDKKLGKLSGAQNAFNSINTSGARNLSVTGYSFDRRGNIICKGTDLDSKEDFAINLGKIDDRTNMKEVIFEHFNISATNLLLNSMKKW